jgi:hypothetical protein
MRERDRRNRGREAVQKKIWVRRLLHTHKYLANADVFISVSIYIHRHIGKHDWKKKGKTQKARKNGGGKWRKWVKANKRNNKQIIQ